MFEALTPITPNSVHLLRHIAPVEGQGSILILTPARW